MIPITRTAAGAALLCGLSLILSGCELLKKNEEVQNTVNQRAVGLQIGAFFDRFGPAYKRTELLDGTTVYNWVNAIGPTPTGQVEQDDRTCTLRITADGRGKILTAEVAIDNPGHVSGSRCGEIFRDPR